MPWTPTVASAVEKEKARRAEIEKVFVAEADPVAWRDALVADRPSVTATRIIAAAESVGWTVVEKYRETYAPPQWVAVDGEAHVYESRVMKVYSLHVESPDVARWIEKGMSLPDGELVAVEVHWLDGKANPVKLGHGNRGKWKQGPPAASVAKLIREARR